jgi:hypothetical protein
VGAGRMGAMGVPGRGPGDTTTVGGKAAAGAEVADEAAGGAVGVNWRGGGGAGVCGDGRGCRGPEMICPGRPAGGAGRAGMGALLRGGCMG